MSPPHNYSDENGVIDNFSSDFSLIQKQNIIEQNSGSYSIACCTKQKIEIPMESRLLVFYFYQFNILCSKLLKCNKKMYFLRSKAAYEALD